MKSRERIRADIAQRVEIRRVPFDLYPGEAVHIPIIATKACTIRAQVCWDNGPITITVMRRSGKVISRVERAENRQQEITWRLRTAEAARDALSMVVITPAEASRTDVIHGELILTAPPPPPDDEILIHQLELLDSEAMKHIEDLLNMMQVDGPPYIASIQPNQAYPGEQVTLTGKNFGMTCLVHFTVDGITQSTDEIEGIGKGIWSVTIPLIKEVPTNCAGNVFIERTFPEAADSQPRTFTFKPMLAPEIISITPTEAGPGETITITGAHFGDASSILEIGLQFGQTVLPVQQVHPLNDTTIKVTLPPYSAPQTTSGEVSITRQYPIKKVTGRGSFLFRMTRPIIESYNCQDGVGALSPDETLYIEGKNFGSIPGQVQLEILPNEDMGQVIPPSDWSMTIISWGDTYIEARLNQYFTDPLMLPFNAQFYIQAASQEVSERKPIRIQPAYTTEYLHLTDFLISLEGPADWGYADVDEFSIKVIHTAELFWAYRGDDVFCSGFTLKNNWKVEHVFFDKINPKAGEGDVYITEEHEGTSNPVVKIHWWNSPDYHHAVYTLRILLKGPKGASYH